MLFELCFHVRIVADSSKPFFGDGKDMIKCLAFRRGEIVECETLGVYTEATQRLRDLAGALFSGLLFRVDDVAASNIVAVFRCAADACRCHRASANGPIGSML